MVAAMLSCTAMSDGELVDSGRCFLCPLGETAPILSCDSSGNVMHMPYIQQGAGLSATGVHDFSGAIFVHGAICISPFPCSDIS